MNESVLQYQAAQFRVALLLKQYNFGAASAAKYLGKPRGLVQSWMQIGNNHYLAKEKIKIKSFEKILRGLRKKITYEHLDFLIAKRLFELDLPVTFISKTMELPTSTVRSWQYGKTPNAVKRFFYDKKIVNYEFNKLIKDLKKVTTRNNLDYFLAKRIASTARNNNGRHNIGGRIISRIITNHYGISKTLPEKTVSCWIDNKRKPWDAFEVLADEQLIGNELNKIINELTYENITYHISKELAETHKWKYSKISKTLGINKELVRGWVKKDRGNPVAKNFKNPMIVKNETEKYLDPDMVDNAILEPPSEEIDKKDIENGIDAKKSIKNQPEKIEKEIEFNEDLEQELIYHLETIPTGISSVKIFKSILIDHQNASEEDIDKILHLSKHIVFSSGKWILKRYLVENMQEKNMKNDPLFLKCETDQNDEIICQ